MKSLFFACIFSICTIFGTSFAESNSSKIETKIYIPRDNIQLKKNNISVHLPEGSFTVELLGKDENGYFIYESELLASKSKADYFCINCRKYFFTQRTYDTHFPCNGS